MDLQLKGRKAIVTGGTRGIGRAIVETLVAEGAEVAFCARNAEEIRITTAALVTNGATVFGAVVDVADGAALKAWIARKQRNVWAVSISSWPTSVLCRSVVTMHHGSSASTST